MYNIENCNNYGVKHKTHTEQIESMIKNKCYTNKIIEKTDQNLRKKYIVTGNNVRDLQMKTVKVTIYQHTTNTNATLTK